MSEERFLPTDIMVLNMGPQHPSTHGVLRVLLEMDGEVIRKAEPIIGYLHRGIEKLAEHKTYHQVIPLTDRLDYLNPIGNNLAYVLAVERLLDLEVPPRAQFIRVLMAELTRIQSHLVWLGTHALDIGAMTPILYCFREREEILNLFEMVSGARMNLSYLRIGGVAADLPAGFVERLQTFLEAFPARVDEYEALLTKNPIWLQRTQGVGVISAQQAINLGLTGPLLRSTGVEWDLRKAMPYSGYERFDFLVPTRRNGDVYDRYLIRLEEMRQSVRIIRQVLDGLPEGPVKADAPKVVPPPKEDVLTRPEALLRHFYLVFEGFHVPPGEYYSAVESPRGELGFYVVSDGGPRPYRLRIRTPSYVNIQAIPVMGEGRMIPDMVAVIGSIDICLGEIDR